jgi:hypothetical protein
MMTRITDALHLVRDTNQSITRRLGGLD